MDDRTQSMLAGLAHDLRTPLAAIGGYAELLRVGVHGPLLPKQVDSLERIRSNQIRMAELLTDMMDYVEAASGTRRMFLEAIDLRHVLTDATGALAERAQQRAVTLVVDDQMSPDSPAASPTEPGTLVVTADRAALESVIRAVLRDTIDSSSACTVTIRLSCSETTAVISVEVSVHPFDEAGCQALFMPFERYAADRRPKGSSALVIPRARLLARSFGGDVIAVPDRDRRIVRIHVAAPQDATQAVSETTSSNLR